MIKLPEITLILIGIFLFIDSLFVGALSYDYSSLGIGFLDPYVSHGVIGIVFIAIGAVWLYYER